eukprot:4871210-Pyramimonas_sp.AAC.1
MRHRHGLIGRGHHGVRAVLLWCALLQTGVAQGEPARRELPSWHPRHGKSAVTATSFVANCAFKRALIVTHYAKKGENPFNP